MFIVHEFGANISLPDGTIIRIPPRPAFSKAGNKTLKQKALFDDSKLVKQAYAKYLRNGDLGLINSINRIFEKGSKGIPEE